MAESAVKSVADWLGTLLIKEGKFLLGAEGKVKELRDELIWLQSFLRDADTIQCEDEIVRLWVLQIKEYVSEAEDIIDEFVIKVVSRRRQASDLTNKCKRCARIGGELLALHRAASGIDSLRQRIAALSPRLKEYGLQTSYGLKTYRAREARNEQVQQSLKYVHMEEEMPTGMAKNAKEVMVALQDSTRKHGVVAIHGMGGLGKTTLASAVYHNKEMRQHFRGGCAWVYVSKQFQLKSVLEQVLASIMPPTNTASYTDFSEPMLVSEVVRLLKENRCLVVLDDIWSKEAWGALKPAFTSCGGSKVLVTTRKEEVAKDADPEALDKPDLLNDKDGWALLRKTLGWDKSNGDENAGTQNNIPPPPTAPNPSGANIHLLNTKTPATRDTEVSASNTTQTRGNHMRINEENVRDSQMASQQGEAAETATGVGNQTTSSSTSTQGDSSDKSLKDEACLKMELGKKMLKYCKGLPLAIVVLGGILRKKETLNEWETVYKNISSYLRRGYNHGRSYEEVLVQSYIDLPYHLKPCFLHLAHFPEDYEIYTERLYWMWMAEGLVTWSSDRIAGTETLEDVANEYLYDLAQAGMVKIIKQTSNGRIKSIRVHDLMREVCLLRATAENFLNIIDHRHCLDKPLNIRSYFSHKRLLRMAIYLADGVDSFIPESLSLKAYKHLRSLFFIGGHGLDEKDKYAEWMRLICTEFQWLRVLDLEGLCLRGRLTKEVQNLVHLRYLSLKGTNVSEVPSFVGSLRLLQVLDLRISATVAFVTLTNTLWKLDRLSQLLLPKQPYEIVGSTTLRLNTFLCLERLENLEVGKFDPIELSKLQNLRRLSIKDNISIECLNIILQSPALKSGCLRSCSFGVKGSVLSDKPSILSRLGCIHRLKMADRISTPIENDVFPRSLRNLHLECCDLEADPMEILGNLSHLKQLYLGMNSFVGVKITCKHKSFLRLTMLTLQGLRNLESWILEQGSMSRLEKLTIKRCDRLSKIPEGLPCFVEVTCSPCRPGCEKYVNCVCSMVVPLPIGSYQRHFITLPMSLLQLSLMDGKYNKVVLFGKEGKELAAHVETLYHSGVIPLLFDAIARASPSKVCDADGFSRRELEGLLRDLNPRGISREGMLEAELIQEIQLAMQQKKRLVILTNVEDVSHHSLDYLDRIFKSHDFGEGSKFLITSTNDEMVKSRDNELFLHISQLAPKYLSLSEKRRPPPATLKNKGYVEALLELALMEDKYKKVVLSGKSGIGKTTHVLALYHSGIIHQYFDAIAWASPSQNSETIDFSRRVLEGILRDLDPRIRMKDLSQMYSPKLIQKIQRVMQQKKCLVILINCKDVDHHDLDYLDSTFGSHGFGEGSKLLITNTSDEMLDSRDSELFLHLCDDHFSSQLAPKSWSLLKNRLPHPASENLAFVAKSSIGMGMAKCSPSHPLCLVMLGGLLAMKDSLAEWEAISSSKMQDLPQIFQLCYTDLPHHMRCCLLSLLNLPKDIELPTKKLYRVWIAAGFVQLNDDAVHSGESLQSITETYLTELVQRGFVKVGKRRPNGKIKTCRLHFALQELCIDKGREENFLIIVHPSESSTSTSNYNPVTKQLVVHLNSPSTTNQEELCSLINSFNSLNSLMVYPNVVDPFMKRKSWEWFIKICNHFHSLRILDLEGMWMTKGSLPKEVGKLVNLRYLSLKGTWVSQLPLSIGKLTSLQTLDLRVRKSISVPNILWKFKYLIHLYLPNVLTRRRAKLQLCGLDHLQTLVNLQTSRVHLSHLLKLKCLKKLSLRKIHLHGVKALDDILNFLGRSLKVTIDGAVINATPYILSSFRNLYKLKIKGTLSVTLCPEMFPRHVEELALKHTKLEQDPIPVLETLPRLESLYFGHESFLGKKMTFSEDFHALKHLKLCSLSNLEILDRNPENDMCNLESIVIRDCWRVQVNLPVKDLQQRTLDI